MSGKPWRCLHFFGGWTPSKATCPASSSSSRPVAVQESRQRPRLLLPLFLANSQPAPMVRKASQPGLQDHCPKNRSVSLSHEPEPVEMQLRTLWPDGADRVKIFNLVSFYLKMQHAPTNLSPGDPVEPAAC